MRLALVATSMTTGGVQSVVRDLANGLVDRGHDVAVISLCLEDEVETDPRVQRWALERPGLGPRELYGAWRELRKALRKFNPDVVHGHAFHANLVGRLAAGNIPFVRTFHSVREGGGLHARTARAVGLLPQRTVAVSEAVAVAHGLTGSSTVIRNGIDLQTFAYTEEARRRGRSSLGLSEDEFVAISVGRLTEAKNQTLLLRSWAEAHDREPGRSLLLVGEGPVRITLEMEADRLGLGNSLRLLGVRNDVPDLLAAADIYVQSSSWEGFPIAILEARASGLAIIATDVGGTREIDPLPERLIPSESQDALCAALQEGVAIATPRGKRSAAITHLEHYSLRSWVGRWEREYESCLGS